MNYGRQIFKIQNDKSFSGNLPCTQPTPVASYPSTGNQILWDLFCGYIGIPLWAKTSDISYIFVVFVYRAFYEAIKQAVGTLGRVAKFHCDS